MYKIGINFDEISDDIHTAFTVMKENNVAYGELRTVSGKNFVFWTDEEVKNFETVIANSGIELVAAATPLFKWYQDANSPEVAHDNFGFNPRLSDNEKRSIIDRTIDIAVRLEIPRLRIFSGLGKTDDAGKIFSEDQLLHYALNLASARNIDLYLENEPVCTIHKKQDIVKFFENISMPNMKFWLDIANLIELDETVDQNFLEQIAERIGYVHVKDFISSPDGPVYVPVGKGEIDYQQILADIDHICANELIITIETHAKINKIKQSVESIKGTRLLLKDGGI